MHERFGEVFNFGVLHMEWPTAVYIFVVFTVTMFLLNTLLFKPVVATLERRAQKQEEQEASIKSSLAEVDKTKAELGQKLSAVGDDTQDAHKKAMDEANAKISEITSAAQAEANKNLESHLSEIAAERTNALAEAKALAADLSKMIQSKVTA